MLVFAPPLSGPGRSYSLSGPGESNTDVGDEFLSECELLTSRLVSGLGGRDDTQGIKGACH